MNTKKAKLIAMICAVAILAITATTVVAVVRRNNDNNQMCDEERYRIRRLMWKIDYTHELSFHFLIYRNGEWTETVGGVAIGFVSFFSPFHDPFYTDVVFVHTKEEAQGFPENIIVAWPITAGRGNEININQIHRTANRLEVALEDFGLVYPITAADLVDNWENVAALRIALGLFHQFHFPAVEPSRRN